MKQMAKRKLEEKEETGCVSSREKESEIEIHEADAVSEIQNFMLIVTEVYALA